MNTYISRTWKFYKYKINGQCKCSECGKPINKTFSFDYREDTEPCWIDIERLKKEKQEWEQESHICNACLRKKIKQDSKDITNNYTFMFSKLDELQTQIQQIIKDKDERIKSIKDMEGKVLIDKDNTEWYIQSIRDGSINGIGFEIQCYKINKQKPWLITDDCRYFSNDKTMWNNFSTLENCKITDEVFSKRKELL